MNNGNSTQASAPGLGFTGVLTLIFVVLKLTNVIQWSWVWVLSPLWISFLAGVLIILVFFLIWLAAGRK